MAIEPNEWNYRLQLDVKVSNNGDVLICNFNCLVYRKVNYTEEKIE